MRFKRLFENLRSQPWQDLHADTHDALTKIGYVRTGEKEWDAGHAPFADGGPMEGETAWDLVKHVEKAGWKLHPDSVGDDGGQRYLEMPHHFTHPNGSKLVGGYRSDEGGAHYVFHEKE